MIMGQVTISGLRVNTIIGTLPEERLRKQELIISAVFDYDAAGAAANDDLLASVDYSAVEKCLVSETENSSFQLLEALAAHLGKKILAFAGVRRVEIAIAKPAASAFGAMITYRETFSPQEQ